MEFTYTLKGSSIIKPIVSEEKDRFLAIASLAELGRYLPNVDTAKNVDLLPFACNAFVANRVNKNDDVSDSETSIAIAKLFVHKPVNIEHKRDQIMGVILSYAFTEFGSNKPLTEEQAKALKDPFNITLGGILWRVINPKMAALIEECSDPASEHYEKVSASWEIGFLDYAIASINGDSRNLVDAVIIEKPEDIEGIKDYMKAFGGKGFKGESKLYRLVKGECLPLGIGLTGTPAGDVKGLATPKTTEEEKPEVIEASEKNKQNTETISQNEKNIVIQERSKFNMKITKIEDITDDVLKQTSATEITEWVKQQIKTADETYQAEKSKLENEVKASKEAAAALTESQTKLQEEVKKLTESVATFQAKEEARAKQDAFNVRMAGLDNDFNLADAEREVIAGDIANLDDTAFASYRKKLDILLAAKKKGAVPPFVETKKEEAKEGAEHEKKEKKECKASVETPKTEKTETVATAIEQAKPAAAAIPATTQANEPSFLEKAAKAFHVDQWISDVKLTD